MVQTVDPFRVRVNGAEVEVDHRTFTLAERRASRASREASVVEGRRRGPGLRLSSVMGSLCAARGGFRKALRTARR
jgi:hypothetical protein